MSSASILTHMRIIVTHTSPDWDAIGSAWLIKKFLPGWNDAHVKFVPAGERFKNVKYQISNVKSPIEIIGEDEVIHVDTGMGPLDHHHTSDTSISAAGLTWEYVKEIQKSKFKSQNLEESERWQDKEKALDRIVQVIIDIDHFKEVFWENPTADHHDFSLLGVLDGLKLYKPDDDDFYLQFGTLCLDALLDHFLNKIWAEEEIAKNGIAFITKWGKGIGFETINDTVLKQAQKMGYFVVVRKDPRKGYVRIKARPLSKTKKSKLKSQNLDVDLTLVYEKLKKIDPDATWYLHVSKKMLLNGTVKNPKMRPTKLSLGEIIKVLETI